MPLQSVVPALQEQSPESAWIGSEQAWPVVFVGSVQPRLSWCMQWYGWSLGQKHASACGATTAPAAGALSHAEVAALKT